MIAAVAGTVLLLSGGAGVAQESPNRPTLLTVTGNGSSMAEPDEATVRLGVIAQAPTAQTAQERASDIITKFVAEMDRLKIARKDVQTSRLTLNPVYTNPGPNQQMRIESYQAQNQLSVRLTNFGLIGKVIDAGVAAGANNVEGVQFGLHNDTDARLKALREAVADGRRKAEAMADAMGVRLTSVYEIAEGGAYMPPPMEMGRIMDKGVATPIEPGQMQISAMVTIRYQISPK